MMLSAKHLTGGKKRQFPCNPTNLTKQLLIYCCFLALIGSGCDKESILGFRGITHTDPYGNLLSADPSDWTFNDAWTRKEKALFSSSFKTGCTPTGNYSIAAFANPNNGYFTVSVRKPATARIQFRLVNKNFRVLISHDDMTADQFALNASTFGVKGIVRLYYKLVDGECEFRGHGDIEIR